MNRTYNQCQTEVEQIANGDAARSQLHKNGSVVSFSTLNNAMWTFARRIPAVALAQYFIDEIDNINATPSA